jgi:hypothetical protein
MRATLTYLVLSALVLNIKAFRVGMTMLVMDNQLERCLDIFKWIKHRTKVFLLHIYFTSRENIFTGNKRSNVV